MRRRTTRGLAEYVLTEEIADLCRCSIHTVRYWISKGKLPSTRPGRRRLVRRPDLLRFLGRNARPAPTPAGLGQRGPAAAVDVVPGQLNLPRTAP